MIAPSLLEVKPLTLGPSRNGHTRRAVRPWMRSSGGWCSGRGSAGQFTADPESRVLVPVEIGADVRASLVTGAVQSPRRCALEEDQNGTKSDVKMLTRIQGVRTKRSIAYLIVSSRPIPNLIDMMPEDG
jgi:hypothetical protein